MRKRVTIQFYSHGRIAEVRRVSARKVEQTLERTFWLNPSYSATVVR